MIYLLLAVSFKGREKEKAQGPVLLHQTLGWEENWVMWAPQICAAERDVLQVDIALGARGREARDITVCCSAREGITTGGEPGRGCQVKITA